MTLLRAPSSGSRAGAPSASRSRKRLPSPKRRIRRSTLAACMLKRKIEVRRDARRRQDRLQQPGPDLGGLQVDDAHPEDPRHRRQRRQQLLQQPHVTEVLAVRGRVLADQDQLAHAVGGQHLGLGEDVLRRPRDERAAKARDRAEGAAPVASRRELQRRDRAPGKPAAQRAGPGAGRQRARSRHRPVTRGRDSVRTARRRADRQQGAAIARGVRGSGRSPRTIASSREAMAG